MNRKQFIQTNGATCVNWYWSWSFVNVKKKTVIFGEFDKNNKNSKSLIFSERWMKSIKGRKNSAYSQSREHIRLVKERGYKLLTFPMTYSDELKDMNGFGPGKIKGFKPVLSEKILFEKEGDWYAFNNAGATLIAEEILNSEKYFEGARKVITVNSYERNSKARAICIKHFGAVCGVCNFDFETKYGMLGRGFIHVHHIVPLSKIHKEYKLDPIRDLVPLCPNCHAMIHLTQPNMNLEELKSCLATQQIS